MLSPSDNRVLAVVCSAGSLDALLNGFGLDGLGGLGGLGGLDGSNGQNGQGSNGQGGQNGQGGANGNSAAIQQLLQQIRELSQALQQLASNTQTLANTTRQTIDRIIKSGGLVARFKLLGTLVAGGSIEAEIHKFDETGYVRQLTGTIHDDEPGGFWSGVTGDEGWCTGRDNQDGHYSIITMPVDASQQTQSFLYNGDTFFVASSGDSEDLSYASILSSEGAHSGTNYLSGERWQATDGNTIITDLLGGRCAVGLTTTSVSGANIWGNTIGYFDLAVERRATSSDPWVRMTGFRNYWDSIGDGSTNRSLSWGGGNRLVISNQPGMQFKMTFTAVWGSGIGSGSPGGTFDFEVGLPQIIFESL